MVSDTFVPPATDVVWNRACADRGDGIGDRHLRALLLVHGMVMNGGSNHAADSCKPVEIAAAAEACRYFGLHDLAALTRELPAAADSEDEEERLDSSYAELVPDDSTICDAFEARYAEAPEDFDTING